jgi:hypothetical protein
MHCNGLDLTYWPLVKHEVERALRSNTDRIDMDDIEKALQEKRMQLWAIHDGEIKCVFVTQIVSYKTCKAVRVIAVTGTDHQEWLKLGFDTLVKWGQENGCSMMEMQGRKGWEKPLKKLGFEEPEILMTKHF